MLSELLKCDMIISAVIAEQTAAEHQYSDTSLGLIAGSFRRRVFIVVIRYICWGFFLVADQDQHLKSHFVAPGHCFSDWTCDLLIRGQTLLFVQHNSPNLFTYFNIKSKFYNKTHSLFFF